MIPGYPKLSPSGVYCVSFIRYAHVVYRCHIIKDDVTNSITTLLQTPNEVIESTYSFHSFDEFIDYYRQHINSLLNVGWYPLCLVN